MIIFYDLNGHVLGYARNAKQAVEFQTECNTHGIHFHKKYLTIGKWW